MLQLLVLICACPKYICHNGERVRFFLVVNILCIRLTGGVPRKKNDKSNKSVQNVEEIRF